MSIRCGKCQGRHDSVADVQACYKGSGAVATATRPTHQHGHRPNKFAGRCRLCGNMVGAGLGRIEKGDKGWLVLHLSGECPPRPDPFRGIPNADDSEYTARDQSFSNARPPSSLPDVPAGHYAVKSATGNNDLDFFRVDRPTQGTWAGRTFVKRVIGGRPSSPVRGVTARAALEAIEAAGPAAAAQLYGQEIGRCSRCNRHLTDETSRQFGMGPECRSR